jgi:uncharacterized protein (TIGR03086 family)
MTVHSEEDRGSPAQFHDEERCRMDTIETMTKVIDETKRVVDKVQPEQLTQATPCTDWDVRALINHITGGSLMFAEAVEHGSVPDDRLGQLLGGDNLGDDYKGSFNIAADRAVAAFGLPGAMDKMVKLPFGEMPAGIALNIAIFDVTVHALDLASATGQSKALAPDVLDAAYGIGTQMIGPDLRVPGVFGPEVAISADAPLPDRILAFAGRSV